MATLTIRDFDDHLKATLRIRAAQHGRSMEAEVREILRAELQTPSAEVGLATQVRRQFAGLYAELDLPDRDEPPRAAEFGE